MPIYEYCCGSCNNKIEAFQSIRDASLTDCQKCGKATLVKLVSAASFRLKGGGWYETDFKKDGDKKKNLVTTDSSAPVAATVAESSVTSKVADIVK